MVGPSVIERSYAATALGELGQNALENVPPLVFEAFLPLLSDSYKAVHQAAARAFRRSLVPEALLRNAGAGPRERIDHDERQPGIMLRKVTGQLFQLGFVRPYRSRTQAADQLGPHVASIEARAHVRQHPDHEHCKSRLEPERVAERAEIGAHNDRIYLERDVDEISPEGAAVLSELVRESRQGTHTQCKETVFA